MPQSLIKVDLTHLIRMVSNTKTCCSGKLENKKIKLEVPFASTGTNQQKLGLQVGNCEAMKEYEQTFQTSCDTVR
ncbi:unnamed protein product [Litomosoides sigmodontis]|uniref:Uncharacterized protein n=1 Tax=Litomosoides sigmodontis TaxID=42156 RepID=A0A3P6SZ11_LITSI|nr:unnamed protein product [Litomosoides sigmodontis]